MTFRARVLFVVPHPIEGPSSRFRVYQFLPALRAHGIEAVVRPFLTSREAPTIYAPGRPGAKAAVMGLATMRRLMDLAGARCFDLAYVLREAFPFGPPLVERMLKTIAGRMIFDFDDALHVPSTAYSNPLDRLRDWGKTAKVVGMADHVVAGSRHLAAFAEAHATPAQVSVVPTVVDTRLFHPGPPKPPGPFTVGWIGTPRGSSYLYPLRGTIARLAEQVPGIRFVFVGAEPFPCEGLPVTFHRWRLDREIEDIRSFDLGIMPLSDDEEARGKCGFKLIEYMSVGIPVVCSAVGANLDIVEEGVTGFFARDEESWVSSIASVARDPSLRASLSAAGVEAVRARYSVDAVAPRLISIIEDVLER